MSDNAVEIGAHFEATPAAASIIIREARAKKLLVVLTNIEKVGRNGIVLHIQITREWE